jgi:hypothetical protein
LEISLFLLRRLLGVKTEDKKQTKVAKLVKGELLLINIGSTSTGGRVLSVKADLAKIQLTSPACTEIGEKVALSRRIEKHWRLVGKQTKLPFPLPFRDKTADHNFFFFLDHRMGKRATWDCIRRRLTICLSLTCKIHGNISSSHNNFFRVGGAVGCMPRCPQASEMR